ncbi:MAG: ATP-binding protein, partial [Gemmatimonadetes bacterium]|nr:ATP-binding protein [Gemmatimonadota bacterium]
MRSAPPFPSGRPPARFPAGQPTSAPSPHLKIAFIGSHGVGKTTLCFDVAARLKRLDMAVELVKEVARACPLPINRDTTVEAQAWILHSQIAEELVAGSRYDVVVSDRSVLDNYAYLVHRAGPQPAYEPLIRGWMRTYDFVFKVPVIAPPSFDGTRDVSEAFQRDVDALIDELLVQFEVDCQRLDPLDRDGWCEAVVDALGLPSKPPQIDIFAADG